MVGLRLKYVVCLANNSLISTRRWSCEPRSDWLASDLFTQIAEDGTARRTYGPRPNPNKNNFGEVIEMAKEEATEEDVDVKVEQKKKKKKKRKVRAT